MNAHEFTLARTPIVCVVGARPNFIKIAPLLRAIAKHPQLPRAILVHTGQHYDVALSERLFEGLELPAPDINLQVGSGTHASQTAEVMQRFEPILDQHRPSCVLVVGDVNSTLACSLVAAKMQIPVVHVEAGLRSFDRTMPEEINRVLTDQLADVLYTTEPSALENLLHEGITRERVHFVGNVMIDSLLHHKVRAVPPRETLTRLGMSLDVLQKANGRFAVATLHRPSNVDAPDTLAQALQILRAVSERIPLICILHPRTRKNIDRFALGHLLTTNNVQMLPAQGYLEMLGLMCHAALVITDSGGIQEETTALGVPCITMRDSTERPITVDQGTNSVVGRDRSLALSTVEQILTGAGKQGRLPELWDGRAAQRIADHLAMWLATQRVTSEA